MLGSCFPMMQAATRMVARPLHHVAHHLTRGGVGHQLHHAAVHPGLAGTAGPQAGGVSTMCVQAPGGLLPAGPVPSVAGPVRATSAYASNLGDAGNGAAFGPASASLAPGSSVMAALGGGVLGSSLSSSGGLAGSVGPLASAALLAAGLAVAAFSAATTAPGQPALQQFAAADRAQPLPFIAAPVLAAPVPAALAVATPVAAMVPLPSSAPGATTPDTTPGARTPDTTAPAGAMMPSTRTSVPEPASLVLLGVGAAATWAARRQSSRRRQRRTA